MLFNVCMPTGGLAPASTVSIMAAVAYCDKITGFTDRSTSFIVQKLSVGAIMYFYVMSTSYGGVVTGCLL